MPLEAPTPNHQNRPAPRFTVASWVVLVGGLLVTFVVYQWAVIHRRPGDWLPGIGEAALGIGITAVGCVGCGLTALLRKERRATFAWIPFLAGLGVVGCAAWNLITRH